MKKSPQGNAVKGMDLEKIKEQIGAMKNFELLQWLDELRINREEEKKKLKYLDNLFTGELEFFFEVPSQSIDSQE